MPENTRLNGSIDQIEGFVEREATPRLLMKLGIQLHLAGLSVSNTVLIVEIFGVERAQSTVHNWFTRSIDNPKLVGVRITLRLTRR
jgi:putative transposase